jgi:hypothetical protein
MWRGFFLAKTQNNNRGKNKKEKKSCATIIFPPFPHYKKPIIHGKSVSGGQIQDVISVVN